MVFVFGFDVPVIEILLVSTIVILITLGFLFYYVRRILSSIEKLEKHLGAHVEKDKPEFIRIEKYVREHLSRGLSEKKIREHLLNQGWEGLVVNEAIRKAFVALFSVLKKESATANPSTAFCIAIPTARIMPAAMLCSANPTPTDSPSGKL